MCLSIYLAPYLFLSLSPYRRFPCEVSRAPLLRLFKDHAQDAELRIAAYLELMRCPDFQVVRVVKEALLNEEVNQGQSSREREVFMRYGQTTIRDSVWSDAY